MANDSSVDYGFSNARVIITFGFTLFTVAMGVSGYAYKIESRIDGIVRDLRLEGERRADNELLITELEGLVDSHGRDINSDRIRHEHFMYQLNEKIINNRVLLSDWIAMTDHQAPSHTIE